MDMDDARPVPADRSGVDSIPIQPPEEEEPEEPWRPGLDYVDDAGRVERRPVELRNTVFDPDAQIDPPAEHVTLQAVPAPRGGEMRRVLPKTFPGVVVGGHKYRPVLQDLPRDLPAERRELHPAEAAPDDQTRALIWMMVRWAVLGVGFVALMVWLNLSGTI